MHSLTAAIPSLASTRSLQPSTRSQQPSTRSQQPSTRSRGPSPPAAAYAAALRVRPPSASSAATRSARPDRSRKHTPAIRAPVRQQEAKRIFAHALKHTKRMGEAGGGGRGMLDEPAPRIAPLTPPVGPFWLTVSFLPTVSPTVSFLPTLPASMPLSFLPCSHLAVWRHLKSQPSHTARAPTVSTCPTSVRSGSGPAPLHSRTELSPAALATRPRHAAMPSTSPSWPVSRLPGPSMLCQSPPPPPPPASLAGQRGTWARGPRRLVSTRSMSCPNRTCAISQAAHVRGQPRGARARSATWRIRRVRGTARARSAAARSCGDFPASGRTTERSHTRPQGRIPVMRTLQPSMLRA